jgi:Uma2 family endonuclease
MSAAIPIASDRSADRIDQRVRLHDIRWSDYESLLARRGERNGTRVTYLEGELELMTPAYEHETRKKTLGRLIETYAEERGIDLIGSGSWTVRNEANARGVEADESYVLDPGLIVRFMACPSQTQAVRALRAALRA